MIFRETSGILFHSYLKPLDFDELFHPVHNVEEAVLVIIPDVSAPHPTIRVKCRLVGLLVVAVAEHDHWALNHQLPHLPRSPGLVSLYVTDLLMTCQCSDHYVPQS